MNEEEKPLELIEEHRKRIDAIDRELVALLNERAHESLTIRGLKGQVGHAVYDPEREERIMRKLEELNHGPLRAQDIRVLWGTMLKTMKEIPAENDASCSKGAQSAISQHSEGEQA